MRIHSHLHLLVSAGIEKSLIRIDCYVLAFSLRERSITDRRSNRELAFLQRLFGFLKSSKKIRAGILTLIRVNSRPQVIESGIESALLVCISTCQSRRLYSVECEEPVEVFPGTNRKKSPRNPALQTTPG